MSAPVLSSLPQPALSIDEKCNSCNKAKRDPGFKTCTSCRKKKTESYREYKKKKAEQTTTVREGENKSVEVATGTTSLKRKAGDDRDPEKRKKKRVKRILKTYGGIDSQSVSESTSQSHPMEFGTEFQTASQMYKRLKKLVRKNTRVSFQACHSIVTDPACDNAKRAALVARDIRKIAKVPFNHKLTIAPATHSRNHHTLRFSCTCTCAAPKSSEQQAKPSLTATIGKLLGSMSSEASTETSAVPCQGTVEVTIMNDNRHPVGIPGQQIRVHIHH
ncbi:hypothetical protein GYMLUDRAFT_39548 [Collybiopsis luxurians FD-317 M1]|nr:hypothetical protein GYMLUDRAFT_39548 [Collybiopsis luxurians FD-317 M1]